MTSSALAPFEVRCPSCETEFPVDPERIPTAGIPAICSTCMRTFLVVLPDEAVLNRQTQEVAPSVEPRSPEPVVDPIPEPVEEPTPEPLEEPVEEPILEPLEEPISEPVEGPLPEPLEEPVEEPISEPVDEPVAEPESSAAAPPTDEAEPRVTAQPPEYPADLQDLSSLADEALSEEPDATVAREANLSLGAARFGRRDPHERARRLARVLVSDIIAYYPEKHARAVEEGRVKETFEEEVKKSWKEFVDQVGSDIAESTDYFRMALNEVLARGREIY